jgi:hypothetical protein
MNEGTTTWALVVGIDEYDKQDLRRLQGAAADAVSAVGWLRKLGVPNEQMFLHVAPTMATRKPLQELGMEYADATKPAIVRSITKLRKVKGGTRLFVFLSGHGLYEPTGRRVFLTQESGVDDQWVNLGIDAYCDLFLATGFRRQFLIMDGCLNYPYATNARTQIPAEGFPGVAGITPDPANALVACFSAAQDQRAAELDGRGAFMHPLLKALDPENPWPDAIDLDFSTGVRTVDIEKLVRKYVAPVVERAVYDKAKLIQTPRVEPLGTAQGSQSPPIYRLPDVTTSKVDVTIEPAQAVPSVQTIWLSVQRRPFWSLSLPKPPANAIEVPVVSRLPKGLLARVVCEVDPTAAWDIVEAQLDFPTDQDRTCRIHLSPLAVEQEVAPSGAASPPDDGTERPAWTGPGDGEPSGPSPTPITEVFGVHTVSRDGYVVPEVDPLYPQVADSLGIDEPPEWGEVEVASGVRMTRHETGPEFQVQKGARRQAGELVREWAAAVLNAAPPEFGVLTVVRGAQLNEPPNLRLALPDGGAAALAGALADHELVWVGRPDQYDRREDAGWRLSLRRLESTPTLRVDPGPVQVEVQLPWGSWTRTELAPAIGELTVELPTSIGTPPLRVRLQRQLGRPPELGAAEVIGTSGERPTGHLRAGLFGEEGPALEPMPAQQATWALAAAPGALPSGQRTPGHLLAVLAGSPTVVFPLHPLRSLAADLAGGAVRIEPLSGTATPEWDLLVTTGQIDALPLQAARNLAGEKWEDELLGLAGTYALWAAGDWAGVDTAIGNLGVLPSVGPDLDLLTVAAGRRVGSNPAAEAASERMQRRMRRGEVPLFRWGIGLALDLLDTPGTSPPQRRWREALELVHRNLSPISVWTAWTD